MVRLKLGDVFDNPEEFPNFLRGSVIDMDGVVYVLIEDYMPYKEDLYRSNINGIIAKDDSFTHASNRVRFVKELTYLGVIKNPSEDYEELWNQYETFKNSKSK